MCAHENTHVHTRTSLFLPFYVLSPPMPCGDPWPFSDLPPGQGPSAHSLSPHQRQRVAGLAKFTGSAVRQARVRISAAWLSDISQVTAFHAARFLSWELGLVEIMPASQGQWRWAQAMGVRVPAGASRPKVLLPGCVTWAGSLAWDTSFVKWGCCEEEQDSIKVVPSHALSPEAASPPGAPPSPYHPCCLHTEARLDSSREATVLTI